MSGTVGPVGGDVGDWLPVGGLVGPVVSAPTSGGGPVGAMTVGWSVHVLAAVGDQNPAAVRTPEEGDGARWQSATWTATMTVRRQMEIPRTCRRPMVGQKEIPMAFDGQPRKATSVTGWQDGRPGRRRCRGLVGGTGRSSSWRRCRGFG
jgi:hypothetical protein